MALYQRDSENADRDLTSLVTVLTDTVDVSGQYVVRIKLGDGAKGLDGTGGDFELTITIDGYTAQPDPQTITFSTATKSYVETTPFTVLSGEEVIAKILSPNAADTDVGVIANLHDVTRALPAVAPNAENGLPIVDANGRTAADVEAIGSSAQSATDLKDFADTGYNPATHKVAGVVLTDTTTTNTDMRGTDSAALASGVNVTQIDGNATNGYNATLKLKQLDINNSAGSAISAVSSGSNGHGMALNGNGSGHGLYTYGGATGHGQANFGGSSSGHGVHNRTIGTGSGMYNLGSSNQPGVKNVGTGSGAGTVFTGGATGKDIDAAEIDALAAAVAAASAPTAASIADAVCDEALSGHSTAGTVGKALSDIDTGVIAIASAVGASSSGNAVNVTVQDTAPLAGVTVVIRNSTDETTVTSGTTDSDGAVTLYVPTDGTYKVRLVKSRYTADLQTLTVSGDTTPSTYTMTAVSGTVLGASVYMDTYYTDIRKVLLDSLSNSNLGKNVSDVALSLTNRAQKSLWSKKPWSNMMVRVALSLTDGSYTFPADFGRIIDIWADFEGKGVPSYWFYESDNYEGGYRLDAGFTKEGGYARVITFHYAQQQSAYMRYQKQLEDFTGASDSTEYSYFPANLIILEAQRTYSLEKRAHKDYQFFTELFNEQFDDFCNSNQWVNRDSRPKLNDRLGTEIVTENYSLSGNSVGSYSERENGFIL